jgi:ribosomal protein S18 acetylase RimI-like enzyme
MFLLRTTGLVPVSSFGDLVLTLSLRPMLETDRAAVLGLLGELNDHEAELSHDRATGPETAAACLADDAEKARETGGAQIVAVIGGRVVGYLALQLGRAGPYVHEHWRDHVHIENIVVASGHRKAGIGQALLAEAERFARAAGRKVILLGVLPRNEIALAAYRRAGFAELSIEMVKVLD